MRENIKNMDSTPGKLVVLLIEERLVESSKIKDLLYQAAVCTTEVLTAMHIKNAVEVFEKQKPDIIITSHVPTPKEEQLFKHFTQEPHATPVIVLSNDDDEITLRGALHAGADDLLLLSNLTAASLRKAIRFCLKRKANGEELQERIERYLLVAKATSDIAWDWEISKRSTYWVGSGIRNTMRYPQDEMTVSIEFWEEHIHPEDKERVVKKLKQVFISGHAHNWEDEYRFKNRDGDYVYIYDRGFIIYRDNHPVRMLGIMEDVTSKVLMEQKEKHEKAFLQKQLTEAVITAQEKERSEIGKELHDNVNQLLSASRLYIDAATTDTTNATFLLTQASSFIKNAIEEIRTLSKVLHTPLIVELGLQESISSLAEEIMTVSDLHIQFLKKAFSEDDVEFNLKLTIYRIIQEQLTNILKHAHATKARIILEYTQNGILLTISDNGIGFDIETKRRGVGISNIRSRASMYNGTMKLESAPEEGSTLMVHFPLVADTDNFIFQ